MLLHVEHGEVHCWQVVEFMGNVRAGQDVRHVYP